MIMCEHCGYDALAVMRNTGPARLDADGAIIESGEWVAAMYESYAADQEWNRGDTAVTCPKSTNPGTYREMHPKPASIVEYGESLASLSAYCRSAERLAEELWQRDLEEVQEVIGEIEFWESQP